RLSYIASKLEPLAQKLPAPATNPAPATAEAPAPAPGTNQFQQLQEEIKRLTSQNALLEAKLKEALSVQPAPLDPRELAKAQQQILLLQKEKDLLKVSLEQEKAKSTAQPVDSVLEQERRIVAEVKQKLAQETELAAALQKENDNLKKQLANVKPRPETSSANADMQQLQAANAALQSSNLALRTEQILLESHVAELTKQLSKRGKNSKAQPAGANQSLETALARLAIYESKAVPFTPEELALFKQPDLKVSFATPAPLKRSVKELPAGAGPIMEEARRAQENGRLDEAEKKYLEVLRQDDKNLYTLGNLAAVQIEQNRLADAEKTISQALSIDAR